MGEGNGTPLQYSCLENPMDGGAWKAAVHGVTEGRTRLSDFTFHFHALQKEMATHSSVLAWRIPGTGEPGGLLSLGSQRVRHDWTDLAAAAADGFTGEFHQMFREQITTIFLPIHKPFPNTDFWVQVKQSQLFGSYQLLPPLWALRSWGNMRGSHPPYMLFLTINKELVCEQHRKQDWPQIPRCIWKKWFQQAQTLVFSHT